MGKYFEKTAVSDALIRRAATKARKLRYRQTKAGPLPHAPRVNVTDVERQKFSRQATFFTEGLLRRQFKRNPGKHLRDLTTALGPTHPRVRAAHAAEMAAQAKKNRVPGAPSLENVSDELVPRVDSAGYMKGNKTRKAPPWGLD